MGPVAGRRTLRLGGLIRSIARATHAWACGALLLLTLLLVSAPGCSRGVVWELRKFEDAHELARQQGKLTFVYFRSWYLVDCTNFEENVLKTPQVLLQTRGLVCVPLDFDWDQPLAQKWGLTQVPAFALVSPSGEILVRQQTPITREDFLSAIREAKAQMAATTQPIAGTASGSPP